MIVLNNVTKQYAEHDALKHLTLTIPSGSFFVLVGPSGSGKTTLLNLLNRLEEPTSGTISIDGQDIREEPLRALRLRTGYVLQQIALFPNLTVAENIALVPHMKKRHAKEIETRIDEWLEKAGLAPAAYRSRYPRELSGGEQQRVGILRAIIGDPSVLLMDEPFSALDPISRSQLQSLIKAIHGALSMTTVFVTHDMNEALLLGDTICVMKSGEIVQVGTPDAIRDHPANDFVRHFFEAGGERLA